MTIKDLQEIIKKAGISDRYYRLPDDSMRGFIEGVIMEKNEDGFRVIFAERGDEQLCGEGLDEASACSIMRQTLKVLWPVKMAVA